MNRRKFIASCACCAFGSCAAFLNQNRQITKTIDSDIFIIKRIEIHLAEHCNLSCKYCSHFSCLAEKEFYNFGKFKKDMEKISSIFNKNLRELKLLGGEPLLNPRINEYVKVSRKCFPDTRISILTNAILLDDMDEKFWKTLNKNNVNIKPSIYPVKINWKSILDKAEKYDVGIYGNVDTGEKLTLDNIEKFQVKTFFKFNFSENIANEDDDEVKCRPLYIPYTMYEGRLYRCFAAAYIRHLNKKFNTNYTLSEGDYIDIHKMKDNNDMVRFARASCYFTPCCRYCGKPTFGLKWENISEHSLSEWT